MNNILIAHRGNRSVRAENTMDSFYDSINKCSMIEFDVQLTKDKVPVVIHDYTINRTSNIDSNKDIYICDLTFNELKQYDFSMWFLEKDPFDTIKNNQLDTNLIKPQSISTLEEVLLFCKSNDVYANIEIKDMKGTKNDLLCVETILNVIQDTNMENDVIVSSFNHSYLEDCYKYNNRIKLGVLEENNINYDIVKYMNKINSKDFNCSDELVNQALIDKLRLNDINVNVFTVNDKLRIKELFSMGVYGIFTDFV